MVLKLSEPADIVCYMWESYGAGDLASTVAYFSEDIAFAIFIPQDVLPFGGGETIGKSSFSDRLQTVKDQFDILEYVGSITSVSGEMVRGQVAYSFRHKLTGEIIQGVMRQVFDFNGGLIVRLHEFHDVERIRAFMRLVSQIAS
jgi:hypothetical protein